MSIARPVIPPSRVTTFFVVVAIFAGLGPPVGALAAFLAFILTEGFTKTASVEMTLITLMFMIIFSYPVGVFFAAATGLLVAVVGLWWRWNNILVPVAAAIISYFAVILALNQFDFGSGLGGTLLDPTRVKDAKGFGILLICLAASVICWYLTRGMVRATWQSA